ncbi:MAG: hypothetical protein IJ124_02950 [Clostridia bacterium]|nr:hypothetical protein [Clostridia bacterium]
MKKMMCLVLALLIAGTAALADAPQLSDSLFSSAKQAVGYLASGEYERLVTLLPFSDVAPSASEWESFAANFSNLNGVQSDYAVAYWTGTYWVVAVPLQAPENGSVEALVLGSEDGSSFIGYRYATWSQVESGYSTSDRVLWNIEYVGGTPTVIAD